uniref:Bm1474 n=1 Tax=Brugia malayi TaxID=6279 RepID=A0A1I9G4F2_BRUMA|nr:Bm1474 [Brugia malayi]
MKIISNALLTPILSVFDLSSFLKDFNSFSLYNKN